MRKTGLFCSVCLAALLLMPGCTPVTGNPASAAVSPADIIRPAASATTISSATASASQAAASTAAATAASTAPVTTAAAVPETPATVPQTNPKIVYWGHTGEKIHIDPDCRTIKNGVLQGSLEDARAAGHNGWCGICSKGWSDERLLKEGNPYAQ